MFASLEKYRPQMLSVLRIFVALLYLQAGLSKYFGWPGAQPKDFTMVSLIGAAGAIELVGSLLLLVGLWTREAAFIMSGEMAVAFLIVQHRFTRSFFPAVNGGQLEAVYCFFFFTFFLVGGGAWTLDRLWRRRQDSAIAPETTS